MVPQFSYKRNVQTHKKVKHVVKVSKSFKCDYYDAQFNHVKNLKRHEIKKKKKNIILYIIGLKVTKSLNVKCVMLSNQENKL